jgi:predicted transcriptional regulator
MHEKRCPFEPQKHFLEKVQFSIIENIDPAKQEIYSKIRNFLLESQEIYPSIDSWWLRRVIPGIITGERFCQIATIDGDIVALSIIKRAKASAKLCTLKVADNYRNSRLGQYLLRSSIKKILSDGSRSVHYSISEPIELQCGNFFTPYGFNLRFWKKGRYRKGVDELVFSADSTALIHELRSRVDTNINSVLFSIKPDYAKLIEAGLKTVEFRRKFSNSFIPRKAYFYVSAPERHLRFSADIKGIVESSPSELWQHFKNEAGVSYETFSNYFNGVSQGKAILLSNIHPLLNPVPLRTLKSQLDFEPPQSYRILRPNSPVQEFINSIDKGI